MTTNKNDAANARRGAREDLPTINERIRAPRVQLITHEGQNVGVVTKEQALQLATTVGLDLVLISDSSPVPVCKIMDYGKEIYEKKKKQSEAKKKQKVIQIKEIKFRPKIGAHDFETKIKQAVQFLTSGKRVKVTLVFRGRENIGKDQKADEIFERINESFSAHDITGLVHEKDSSMGQFCSRVYYIK